MAGDLEGGRPEGLEGALQTLLSPTARGKPPCPHPPPAGEVQEPLPPKLRTNDETNKNPRSSLSTQENDLKKQKGKKNLKRTKQKKEKKKKTLSFRYPRKGRGRPGSFSVPRAARTLQQK
ncbi:hypothetical protein D623_10009226 [Myotis brandtii]|uniref:Uncharacterized protein n=1 Tax=Myotis brandtii TaxID=109478 RepID=S7NIF0_MYOBR|nr:hypothetical protein D623_10009226 [Myotis brandtii]